MALSHRMYEALYEDEKAALERMVAWGRTAQWAPVDPEGLEFDSRQELTSLCALASACSASPFSRRVDQRKG